MGFVNHALVDSSITSLRIDGSVDFKCFRKEMKVTNFPSSPGLLVGLTRDLDVIGDGNDRSDNRLVQAPFGAYFLGYLFSSFLPFMNNEEERDRKNEQPQDK